MFSFWDMTSFSSPLKTLRQLKLSRVKKSADPCQPYSKEVHDYLFPRKPIALGIPLWRNENVSGLRVGPLIVLTFKASTFHWEMMCTMIRSIADQTENATETRVQVEPENSDSLSFH